MSLSWWTTEYCKNCKCCPVSNCPVLLSSMSCNLCLNWWNNDKSCEKSLNQEYIAAKLQISLPSYLSFCPHYSDKFSKISCGFLESALKTQKPKLPQWNTHWFTHNEWQGHQWSCHWKAENCPKGPQTASTDPQSKNSEWNPWKEWPTSSRVPGCSATSCLWAPPNNSPAPSSPPTHRQPRRRPTQPSDTQPRALSSRNFVRILLASWLRWQLWSNCVWLKVFKVAKRQCGDQVDHVETNPFRVDSTQWTGFRGKEGKDVGQTELKRPNFL